LKNRYNKMIFFAGATLLVDQLTKVIVEHTFPEGEVRNVIPGFFSLVHVRNRGGAFGFLSGLNKDHLTLFFLGISVLALCVIFYLYKKMGAGKPWVAAALAMIFGGASGNLIDRLRFREVIDFLDFHVGPLHWPAFNVADSAISIGAVILLYHLVMKKI